MPLVRFPARRLLFPAAAFALMLGFATIHHRRADFLERAQRHGNLARPPVGFTILGLTAEQSRRLDRELRTNPGRSEDTAYSRHHRALEAKYERAARYPWLPVPPDLPDPE